MTRRKESSFPIARATMARLWLSVIFAILAMMSDVQITAVSTADQFTHQQALTFPGQLAGDQLGFSVAINGETAIVGAPGDDLRLTNITPLVADSGAAYVFVRSGGLWALEAQLRPLELQAGRRFASAVALTGNLAVVTAPEEDVMGAAGAGAVYLFERSGTTWALVQALHRTAKDRRFGRAVDTDGQTVVITSDFGTPDLSVFGAFELFARVNNGWTSRQGTISLAPVVVDVTGDVIGIGTAATGPSSMGGGREPAVFDRQPNGAFDFELGKPLSAPDVIAQHDVYGASIAMGADRILIGAPRHQDRGAVFAFQRSGSQWVFVQKLTVTVPGGALFGSHIALSGDLAVIGAAGQSGGTAYVFEQTGGTWTFRQTLTAPQAGVTSTRSVAISGETIIVGAATADDGGVANVFVRQSTGTIPPGGGAPTMLPSIVTGSTVQLSWTSTQGATRYQLRAGTAPGGSNAFDGNVGATTSLVAPNVPNGSYFVRVHAVGVGGESGPSNEVRVEVGTTSGCAPAAPSNLSATVAGTFVALSWTAAAGATTHVVEAGSASGLANLAVVNVGGATTLSANAPPGRYFVRVRGANGCGSSAASNEIIVDIS